MANRGGWRMAMYPWCSGWGGEVKQGGRGNEEIVGFHFTMNATKAIKCHAENPILILPDI